MPFTPFHLGPAAAIKLVAGRYFSFSLFALSQVLIDLESLYYLLQQQWPVHRFFHSYMGATVVAAIVYFLGRPLCELLLKTWNRLLSPKPHHWFYTTPELSRTAALSGTILGVYSHVVLDSIMHPDIRPFAPFSDENNLLHLITLAELHIYCGILGVVGMTSMLVIFLWSKWTYEV